MMFLILSDLILSQRAEIRADRDFLIIGTRILAEESWQNNLGRIIWAEESRQNNLGRRN